MKLIFPILFLIIAVALFFVMVDPLYKEVKQLKTDMSTYSIALNNSTELQKVRDSLLETYKNVKKEDKDRLIHLLPTTINNIELILEIEKIANLHGMPIGNIKFETKNLENQETKTDNIIVAENDPADYLPYGIFPMEFVIEGKYETFVSFLKDLEHNLRLVDIKSISFDVPNVIVSPTPSVTDSNIYSYTLKVDTYWLK
jgi:Tfp pilus assembly protein PilO